ncbi:BEM_HP_G0080730.mRNA.1.CDS.1 [Saccharomyces cerevisiae]|nr:BEM_HP_G0080730.mRNA.1.CDS.1 [Saccharomyces cerevisiae]CAI6992434.1 BEM_HP_G0080730.mRNA.1.CDS.1 [Saccharomyces cerevisiae]
MTTHINLFKSTIESSNNDFLNQYLLSTMGHMETSVKFVKPLGLPMLVVVYVEVIHLEMYHGFDL